MRNIFWNLLSGFLLIPCLVFGGGENPSIGARSLGLANASIAIEDEWALFNNIAGINNTRRLSSIASFHNLYGIPSLNQVAFGVSLPYKKFAGGISFYKFGDTYYNEIQTGLGCAHRIQNVSLGIKINYHQISIHETGCKRNLILEMGGLVTLSKNLTFGAHIYNINQAKISKEGKEYIPVIMKLGGTYRFFEKLSINVETEKQLDFKSIFKSGIEYAIIKKLKLRGGVSLNPTITYFGIGFNNKNIAIDYAMSVHNVLGISQQISLTYVFIKKDK